MWTELRKLTIAVTTDGDWRKFYELSQEFSLRLQGFRDEATFRRLEVFRGFQVPEAKSETLWDSIPHYRHLRELNIGPISVNPRVLLEHMRYLQQYLCRDLHYQVCNRIVTYDIELNLVGFGFERENKDYLEANVCTDLACAQTQRNLWEIEMWACAYSSIPPQAIQTCYKEHFRYTFEYDDLRRWDDLPEGFGQIRVQLKGLIVKSS